VEVVFVPGPIACLLARFEWPLDDISVSVGVIDDIKVYARFTVLPLVSLVGVVI
jgi:hypothetical protein